MNLDIEITKSKLVDLNEIYNFVVDIFYLKSFMVPKFYLKSSYFEILIFQFVRW